MSDLSKAMKEATAYLDRQKEDKRRPEPKKEAKTSTKISNSVRSKTREVQSNPTLILAYGFAIALSIFAGGLSTQWLVPALGAGFGIATTIISKGISSSSVNYSWAIPAGAAGLALIGGVGVVFLLMKIIKRAAKQPYLAVLPVLAVMAGFCVDMVKDFYPNVPLVRIAFGGVTSVIFVLGGLWWKRYGLLNKLAGTLLILISPLVIVAHGVSGSIDQGLGIALGNLTTQSWIAIAGLIAILVVTGLLAFTLGEDVYE